MLTQQRLKELLGYEPETGLFTWAVSRGRARINQVAGEFHNDGYIRVRIDGKSYASHRLVWLYIHGVMPTSQIDHLNGKRDDNRLENLRAATHSENQQNLKNARTNNKAGLLGVCFINRLGKFRAKITVNGKNKYIGYFTDKHEAHQAYLNKKSELHPFETLKK